MYRRLVVVLLTAVIFSETALADNCERILQTVQTMRDARGYFRCLARQLPVPAPVQPAADLPEGAIIAWDAMIRDENGLPTGGYRAVPVGWKVCDGSHGTPDLSDRFLLGSAVVSDAGKTGGRAIIQESGAHTHAGSTGVTRGPDHPIHCTGKCSGGRTAAHSHTIDIAASGEHSHGSNLPPFYRILYLCKTAPHSK